MEDRSTDSRRRDLATRVEEQGERIAALNRETEELRSALVRREAELASSREEQNRLRTAIERLEIQKREGESLVEQANQTISEVKSDARRLAEEVVKLQRDLKKEKAGPPDGGQPPSALQEVLDGYQDQTARLRKDLAIAHQAQAALEVSYREIEHEFLALQRASNAMIATNYLDEVLLSILAGLEEGLGYDLAVLMVLDRQGGFFFPRVRPDNVLVEGTRAELGLSFERIRIPLAAKDNALARLDDEPTIVVHDSPLAMFAAAEPAVDAQRLGAYLVTRGQQVFAAVPMMVRGEVAGALFCSRSRASISARERESLQNFSNQAGMAIENIQLVTNMRRVRDELAGKNETLIKTNEKLIELERTKEALTSMMVHDMKNPLTSIRGYLELLMDEPPDRLPDELKRHVKISYDSSGRLLDMVRELLDISKMEAGKFKLTRGEIDFRALLTSAHAEQSVLAERGKKTLEIEIAPDLPTITGDVDLLGRVVVNLVSNSVKHTPRGSRIRVIARPAAGFEGVPPDAAVLVSIEDDGEGIPKEYQEKIFEKFGTIEARAGGAGRLSTGLGLTFCKMAVEAHGGRIWLVSENGQGASFHMALPSVPPEAN